MGGGGNGGIELVKGGGNSRGVLRSRIFDKRDGVNARALENYRIVLSVPVSFVFCVGYIEVVNE